jgi:hypothetical protein
MKCFLFVLSLTLQATETSTRKLKWRKNLVEGFYCRVKKRAGKSRKWAGSRENIQQSYPQLAWEELAVPPVPHSFSLYSTANHVRLNLDPSLRI